MYHLDLDISYKLRLPYISIYTGDNHPDHVKS